MKPSIQMTTFLSPGKGSGYQMRNQSDLPCEAYSLPTRMLS